VRGGLVVRMLDCQSKGLVLMQGGGKRPAYYISYIFRARLYTVLDMSKSFDYQLTNS